MLNEIEVTMGATIENMRGESATELGVEVEEVACLAPVPRMYICFISLLQLDRNLGENVVRREYEEPENWEKNKKLSWKKSEFSELDF